MLRGRHLACIRGDRPVFSGLDFDLPSGRALILRGANGSGKSSLMKLVAGLLEAVAGSLLFGERAVLGDRDWISRHICYLAHKNGLKPEMTVAENLAFWARIENHQNFEDRDIRHLADRIGIAHCLDLPVCYLSSGQARRAAMARVLCHPGKIWLLDEPTVGLDAAGVALLAGLMQAHLERGGRILAATHIELGLAPETATVMDMVDHGFDAGDLGAGELLC